MGSGVAGRSRRPWSGAASTYLLAAPALLVGLAALLGLQHEGVAAVEVDAAGRAVAPLHRPLENVVVGFGARAGGIGPRHADDVAQLRQEERVVGPLRPADPVRPPPDELLYVQGAPADLRRVIEAPSARGQRTDSGL